MNKKMRLNVSDESDPALISKKFWSYVKSKCKSAEFRKLFIMKNDTEVTAVNKQKCLTNTFLNSFRNLVFTTPI